MPHRPLVSVLMPCWNSAGTLPAALASLQAQTYENWECILVDDGSTDDPASVVAAAADPRIRYIRLDSNRGRGAARQVALERANGELVAMLDADDWLYPGKLGAQVCVMLRYPELSLVSTGMAIVDARNELCGVRRSRSSKDLILRRDQARALRAPAMPFAPSMLRADRAKKTGFDASYPIAEDLEFLLRFTTGQAHGILPEIAYVYNEHSSNTVDKVSASLRETQRVFSQYRSQFPMSSRLRVLETAAKVAIYRLHWYTGAWRYVISRRSLAPQPDEIRGFRAASSVVRPLEGAMRARLTASRELTAMASAKR
jgi:glycosyltransferase involved in cell wall biosynthesis